MNFLSRSTLVVAAVLASSAFAGEWTLDSAHSSAQFSVKHMMVSTVRGEFQKISGTVSVDEKDVTKSKVNVTIDPASINTRQEKRDEHLRSADFFDVAQYPTMTFVSTKVQKGKAGKLKVTGDLTMHGVTKPVTLDVDALSKPVKNPWGQTVLGFSATGKLNRKDFGLNWNKGLEAGGVLVGDEIALVLDGELNEAAPAPAAAGK